MPRTQNPSLKPWHQRWEVWLFLFIAALLYIFLMTLVYKDVMKDDSTGVNKIQNNRQLDIFFRSSLVILLFATVYVVYTLFACAYHYNRDLQTLHTFKTIHKKVKDMTTVERKRHYQHQHAKNRLKWYACGPLSRNIKIITILSTIAALFLRPYVKEKKTTSLFILLAILLTPVLFMFSASLLFLIGNTPTYYSFYY